MSVASPCHRMAEAFGADIQQALDAQESIVAALGALAGIAHGMFPPPGGAGERGTGSTPRSTRQQPRIIPSCGSPREGGRAPHKGGQACRGGYWTPRRPHFS